MDFPFVHPGAVRGSEVSCYSGKHFAVAEGNRPEKDCGGTEGDVSTPFFSCKGAASGRADIATLVENLIDRMGQVRLSPCDGTRRFNPVHSRHVNVHHGDIRLERVCKFHRLFPIRCVPHQFDVDMMAKILPEAMSSRTQSCWSFLQDALSK